jgi:hypothetical protein
MYNACRASVVNLESRHCCIKMQNIVEKLRVHVELRD